jgi:hypothetical protein
MSGAREREARRAKSWERAERSEESALSELMSEPRCEQSEERSGIFRLFAIGELVGFLRLARSSQHLGHGEW